MDWGRFTGFWLFCWWWLLSSYAVGDGDDVDGPTTRVKVFGLMLPSDLLDTYT